VLYFTEILSWIKDVDLTSVKDMIITKEILDELSAKAKENPRLRLGMDMRNSADDQSQRMLNALEPGTVMPIHRHLASSETVIIIRGRIRWLFYDEQGRITESTELWSDGDVRMLNVEKGRWHSLECLESGSVLFESKDGPYHPLEENEIMFSK
jgi:cupin fold WbuC family metalloprotein